MGLPFIAGMVQILNAAICKRIRSFVMNPDTLIHKGCTEGFQFC